MAAQGGLDLLAEHPSWNWSTLVKITGTTTASLTTYLKGLGFSQKQITDYQSGKINATQFIALKPATGMEGGDSSGVSSAAGQVVDAAGGAINSATGGIFSSIGTVIGDVTNINLWKGIGLVLAGGLILIFAAYEFAHMAGVKAVPVPV